jgi:hypothetical protein
MDYILDLLIKNFLPWLNNLWNSLEFWRSLALILLLLFSLVWSFRGKLISLFQNPSKLEHDRKIFLQADEILPEKAILSFLSQLGSDHSHSREAISRPYRFFDFFKETSNQFIDKSLKLKSNKFADDLDALMSFTGSHFWQYPSGQTNDNPFYCLHPELNIDRDGDGSQENDRRYSQYSIELRDLIQKATTSYRLYRELIQQKMHL